MAWPCWWSPALIAWVVLDHRAQTAHGSRELEARGVDAAAPGAAVENDRMSVAATSPPGRGGGG